MLEVYFLDVGQGTASIISFGNGEAIVIDSGPKSAEKTLFKALSVLRIDTISLLLISHNDEDHAGNATALIDHFQDQILAIGFVEDVKLYSSGFWGSINDLIKSGQMKDSQLIRLERTPQPWPIFPDPRTPSSLPFSIEVWSPIAFQNIQAKLQGKTNSTSAVVAVKVGNQTIVFCADSEIDQWRSIYNLMGNAPVQATILAVSHHGGLEKAVSPSEISWMYTTALQSEYSIISVGTANGNYKHPRPVVVSAIRDSGSQIMCTQITAQCHPDLESIRPGVAPTFAINQSQSVADKTPKGKSRNVACGGTIMAKLVGDRLELPYFQLHSAAIVRKVKCPLCKLP